MSLAPLSVTFRAENRAAFALTSARAHAILVDVTDSVGPVPITLHYGAARVIKDFWPWWLR